MVGAWIETEARRIRDEAIREAAAKASREAVIKMAIRLLQTGKNFNIYFLIIYEPFFCPKIIFLN